MTAHQRRERLVPCVPSDHQLYGSKPRPAIAGLDKNKRESQPCLKTQHKSKPSRAAIRNKNKRRSPTNWCSWLQSEGELESARSCSFELICSVLVAKLPVDVVTRRYLLRQCHALDGIQNAIVQVKAGVAEGHCVVRRNQARVHQTRSFGRRAHRTACSGTYSTSTLTRREMQYQSN
jgi:hypothetical protein